MRRFHLGRAWAAALVAIVFVVVGMTVTAARAAPGEATGVTHDDASVSDFARGLTNPRHIRFGPDGLLYVAEAGIGGPAPATATPGCALVDNMFSQLGPYKPGFTGRISRIRPDGSRETADGLPSISDNLGDSLGPTDVAWIGRTLYASLEGGGCSRGLPNDPAGIVRINRDGSYTFVADISAFVRANPVANEPACGPLGDCEPDGVPHSLLAALSGSTSWRRTTTASSASTRAPARSRACTTSPCRIPRRSC
ncbi:MAG: hypothetical protein ACRDMY_03930 [Gaiellaceae bacterium]